MKQKSSVYTSSIREMNNVKSFYDIKEQKPCKCSGSEIADTRNTKKLSSKDKVVVPRKG